MDLKVTENKHIDQLAPATNLDDAAKKKIADTAKQFEGLLTQMMMKSMTSTTEGMFGDSSNGGDYFETIFQQEISSYMSKKNDMGIASLIYKKMTGEDIKGLKLNFESPLKGNFGIPPVQPGNSSLQRLNKFDGIINDASGVYNVDPDLIKSVILAESAANEKAVSKVNAKGLMQLMDGTAKELGVNNVWDPKQNIYGGTKYLSELLQQFNGDMKLALAGYNSGPGNVEKYKGIPPFEETQNYVSRVIGYYNHLKSDT